MTAQLGFRGVRVCPANAYSAGAVNIDGTNDYLTRGAELTGMADGKVGTFSCWFKAGDDGTWGRFLINPSERFGISRSGDQNGFYIVGRTSAATAIIVIRSNANLLNVAAGWVHMLCSWDLAVPKIAIYINDVEAKAAGGTLIDGTIDYTRANWGVGADQVGGNKLNGDVADMWFNLGFLDIDVVSNRRKFIDLCGKPVDLGSSGQTPTGTSPIVFLSGVTSTWHTNDGTGGGFTENGELTDSATSPSD